MIIVDISLIAPLFIEGRASVSARRILEAEPDWVASPFWRTQFCDLLVANVRSGAEISERAVERLIAADLIIRNSHERINDLQVFDLAVSSGVTAHQATSVWIARTLSAPFFTADQNVLKAFPNDAIAADNYKA